MRSIVLALCIAFVVVGCRHAPPSLTPAGASVWQANEVAVAVGTVQSAAIGLNQIQICDPAPCHPVLSDDNTRVVVEAVTDGLNVLRQAPAGWKATGLAIADRIDLRLDAAGKAKLKSYVEAARIVIGGL